MSSFVILSHSGKKLVEGQLWAEVTQVTIWGHMRVLPNMPQVEGPKSNQSIIETKVLCLVIMYVVGVNYCVQSSEAYEASVIV